MEKWYFLWSLGTHKMLILLNIPPKKAYLSLGIRKNIHPWWILAKAGAGEAINGWNVECGHI